MKSKLGDMLNIRTGKLDANASSPNGKYPFFTCSKEPLKIDTYSYDCECVLVAGNGDLNVKYYNGKFDAYQRTYILESNSNKLYMPYLYFFMDKYVDTLRKQSIGGVIKYIKLENITNASIELPEVNSQKEICNKIYKVKVLINKQKKTISYLDTLIKARFVEMFGDLGDAKKYTLLNLLEKEYILYHLDGNHGSDYPRNSEFVDNGVPYIGANCIMNGEIKFDNCKYVTKERANKFKKGIAINEDVLFANNATVGPTAILHTNYEKVILSTSLTAFRCNKEAINPYYLKEFMLSKDFVNQYRNDMKQTTRNQVPITMQRKYVFLIPDIYDQNKFATFVKEVDKLKFD